MVIDSGTALTFTTISKTGEIIGVAIAPGLSTALKSLTEKTAQLPDVQLVSPHSVLGKNTIHAIQSGLVFGFAGLVDSIVERTENELDAPLTVIATGGLSPILIAVSKKNSDHRRKPDTGWIKIYGRSSLNFSPFFSGFYFSEIKNRSK